jgi:hypothetical protein
MVGTVDTGGTVDRPGAGGRPGSGVFASPAQAAAHLPDNPTAQERADFVTRRLEQFIRDNRTIDRGVNFRQWQAMAQAEIVNAIQDAELDAQKDDVVTKRLMFIAAASLVTVGFWGVAFAWGRVGYMSAALICGLAALALFAGALEWPIRRAVKRHARRRRGAALGRIEDLNARIRQMERELKREEKALEERLASARHRNPGA